MEKNLKLKNLQAPGLKEWISSFESRKGRKLEVQAVEAINLDCSKEPDPYSWVWSDTKKIFRNAEGQAIAKIVYVSDLLGPRWAPERVFDCRVEILLTQDELKNP